MNFSQMNDPDHLQSFVKLLTQHQGEIRGYIVSLMPGSCDVGDVLQETNLVMWNKREDFEIGTNFIAWAFAIARFQVLRQRKKAGRAGSFSLSEKLIGVLADTEAPSDSHEQYLQALERCLAKLTDRERKMVACRYTSGRSLVNLADSLGESPGSLRIALMRIRSSLKACIEKQGMGGTA